MPDKIICEICNKEVYQFCNDCYRQCKRCNILIDNSRKKFCDQCKNDLKTRWHTLDIHEVKEEVIPVPVYRFIKGNWKEITPHRYMNSKNLFTLDCRGQKLSNIGKLILWEFKTL